MSDNPFEKFFQKQGFLFSKGSVFHCKQYEFSSEFSKDKYILFLSDKQINQNNIIVLPTSQTEQYIGNAFSIRDNQYIITIEKDTIPNIFPKRTIIDLSKITTRDTKYFFYKHDADELKYKGKLPDSILQQIDKIIPNIETLEEEIIEAILL